MAKITLAHGGGGEMTHELIQNVFFKYFGNDILNKAGDSACLRIEEKNIAFTTDSFVIQPLFFPGGDIGKLSICGTVNDLAVQAATPKFISCGFIIEEGFEEEDLIEIVGSMSEWAKKAGVQIVTGDTKVVEKGAADGLFINTSGIGVIKEGICLGKDKIRTGDKIIITGNIGDHGIAILGKRKGLEFESSIVSDCAPLNKILTKIMDNVSGVKFMRDPTRGGVATVLNEIAQDARFGVLIDEVKIPVDDGVRAACELLGLDALYIANEGKALIIADKDSEEEILNILKQDEYTSNAAGIGEIVADNAGKVCLKTRYGVVRMIDRLTAEPLPRIC
ncbi:MAG: hydrogenase expression/formation protein HypE [Candidatus Omnitrophota bacterium]